MGLYLPTVPTYLPTYLQQPSSVACTYLPTYSLEEKVGRIELGLLLTVACAYLPTYLPTHLRQKTVG